MRRVALVLGAAVVAAVGGLVGFVLLLWGAASAWDRAGEVE